MEYQSPFTNEEPFWISNDENTKILRHCDSVFSLIYRGREVFPSPASFEKCSNYAWSEFII